MNCEKCSNPLSLNSKFCGKCGEPTKEVHVGDVDIKKKKPTIKCGNCGYVGEAESNRSIWAQVLAWLCLFPFWIITLLYFVTTKKYKCTKCKSTFIGIKDKNGNFFDQKSSALKVIVYLILGIALVGIISSVILASLTTARERSIQQEYPEGWTTYNAIADKFSILVPSSPDFKSNSGTNESGIPYEYRTYTSERGTKYFFIAKYIYKTPIDVSDPTNFLERLMNAFVSGSESRLISSNYSNYRSYQTLNFISRTTDLEIKGRIMLVGETPYLIAVSYYPEDKDDTDHDKFINSFEIK